MSRIYDALRRGRQPAHASTAGRTAQADSVLAALGYESEPRRSRPGVAIAAVALVVFAGAVWWMLPTAKPAPPPRATVAKPNPLPPASKPVAAPPKPAPALVEAPKPAVVAAATAPPPRIALPPKSGTSATPKTVVAPAASPPVSTDDELRRALYYQRSGDYDQALAHYRTVLQRDEMNVDAHNNLGNLYMAKGLHEEAAREFRRVIAIDPRYVTAHVNLAAALYQLKRYDEAGAEARAALRLDSRNDAAYVNLALAQAGSGQAGDAASSLTRALEIDKHNAAAHYNLALQYEKAGEVALAIDHYRAFLQYAGPDQAMYSGDVRARVQALEQRMR